MLFFAIDASRHAAASQRAMPYFAFATFSLSPLFRRRHAVSPCRRCRRASAYALSLPLFAIVFIFRADFRYPPPIMMRCHAIAASAMHRASCWPYACGSLIMTPFSPADAITLLDMSDTAIELRLCHCRHCWLSPIAPRIALFAAAYCTPLSPPCLRHFRRDELFISICRQSFIFIFAEL
jgi:hypothetical protein